MLKCFLSGIFAAFFAFLPQVVEAQFQLNGDAELRPSGCYRLTRDQDNENGNMLSTETIDLSKPFFVDGFLNFGDNNRSGADGMAFIFSTSNTVSGNSGEGIGYQGISPSLIVEMDTYQNGARSDPGFDHMAIMKNGNPDHATSDNLSGPLSFPSNIEDDQDKCFILEWNPTTFELSVSLDGNRLRYIGDIVNDIFGGNPNVHWGFTASTGGSSNRHRVCLNGSTSTVEPMQDSIICMGDTIQLVATPNGQSYTWEPADSLSAYDIQNPFANPIDTTDYLVTIEYQCGARFRDTVEVLPFLPPIEFEPAGPFCESDTDQVLVVSPSGGILSGTAINNDQFNPSVAGVGTFDINYEVEERGCLNDSTITITVDSLTPMAIMPLREFCENELEFDINFSPVGGDWKGDVTLDGKILPSNLGAGDFQGTYVFTNGNNCTDSISVAFKVNPKPAVSIDDIQPICLNADSIALDVSPISGGIWMGDLNDSLVNPNILGVGNFEAIYEYTDNLGCIASDTVEIIVNDLPTINFDPVNPICGNEMPISINSTPIGGNWTGDVDNAGGFDPTTFQPGDYNAIYEFTDGNSCTNIDSLDFTILPVPTVGIMPVDSLCPDGQIEDLIGSPNNGIWSGASNPNGTFDPTNIGAGTHKVLYEFTNMEGCTSSDSINIIVRQPDVISFSPVDPFCLENQTNQLDVNPSGGDWSGDVSNDGTFNPEDLNFGDFSAIYTYTSSAGCVKIDSIDFQILQPVDIVFGDSIFCQNEGNIQLNVNPSGGIWSGNNISTNGEIDPMDFQIGNNTVSYEFIQTPGNCTVEESVNLTINPTPVLEIIGDTIFCQTLGIQTFQADPLNGMWSGPINSDGELDPRILFFGSHFINYSFTSADQCTNDITQEIIVTPPPEANIVSGQSICEGGGPVDLELNFSGSGPFDITISDGQNSDVLTGLNNGDVYTVNPSSTTIYTITQVENSECGNTISSTATVSVNEPPFAEVAQNIQVCDSDETGETTQINFSDLITDGDVSGNWVDLDNSNASGIFPNIDFSGVGVGTYQFEYTTNSAQAPCVDQTYLTEVSVIECRCPSVETTAPPSLCSDNAILDLSSLEVTTESGSWSIQMEPTNSTATIIRDEFNGTSSPAGEYLIRFNLSSPSTGACPESSEQIINLIAPPIAEFPTLVDVCNSTITGEPTSIDFSSLFTNGDNTGTWEDVDNSGAVGTFSVLDFLNLPEGMYQFRYTTAAAIAPCNNQSFDLIVEVRDCRCPSVSTSPAGPFCSDDAFVNLDDITNTNESGGWLITSEPSGSTATLTLQEFDATNSAAGDYELTFILDQTPPAGCAPSSSQIIRVNEKPFAVVLDFGEACNSNILGDPTTFDFNSLIVDGNPNGVWEDLDNSGGVGSFPILDFENIPEGRYRFKYTIQGDAPCIDEVFEITLSVVDCACPSLAISPAGPFCNNDARLDLSTITFTNEPGNWFLTNSPASSTATLTNGIFDATGSSGGEYELTYILSSIPPAGCPQSAAIIVEVGEVVSAGIAPSIVQICNDGSLIDLNAQLIDASPGGFWRDLSVIPADGFDSATGEIDGSLIADGTYVFEYVANTISPCVKDSISFQFDIENPLAPGFSIDNIDFCSGTDSTASLFDAIQDYDLGGEWIQISGQPSQHLTLSQGIISSIGMLPGRYVFEYRVNEDGLCPLGTVIADVIVNETPLAIAGDDFELNCDVREVQIGPNLTNPNFKYSWTGAVSDSTVSNPIVTNGGTYILRVADSDSGCFDIDEVVISEGNGIPQMDINNFDISCFGTNDGEIQVIGVTGGSPPYLFSINGSPFTNQQNFNGLAAGNYTVEIEDSEGCLDFEDFEIIEPIELSIGLSTSTGRFTIESGDSLTISTSIVGSYDTIIWRPNQNLDICQNGCLSQIVVPEVSTSYMVTITNEEGCSAQAMIPITVLNTRFVYVPTAFSPNNDGINDFFQIFVGKNVVRVKDFAVFDRWGETLYQQKDFFPNNSNDGWDGLYRGKFMQTGVYVYYAEIEFSDGRTELFKGDFLLTK